jgi:NAD(P)H dehydrogenase (quinone)
MTTMLQRALVLYAHPNPESYGAALHAAVVETLKAKGYAVDDCDLYAEDFQPVLTRQERIGYHSIPENIAPVADYVHRLRNAEILVVVTPIWNFGWPAILKGFFDRVFLPGVSFDLKDGTVSGALTNIKRVVFVTTYGGSRLRALLVGDPPRKVATRVLRGVTAFKAPILYLAHYDMNRSTDQSRAAFLDRVRKGL